MVSPRRMLGRVAAGSAAVILSALLTGSAHADTDSPSCPDATASLAQARVIVSGASGHGGTAGRLGAAQKADEAARAQLQTDLAADKTEDTDYGTAHADTQDGALKADITERDSATSDLAAAKAADTADDTAHPTPADPAAGDALDKAVAAQTVRLSNAQTAIARDQGLDAAEDGIGVEEDPQDTQDLAVAADRVAINGVDGTAAKLKTAQDAERKAEQGVADAKAAADKACAPGKDGKDGIDAQIVLSPGVCAEAQIQPGDVQRLIRVVTLVPCPPATPPAPAVPPVVGGPVVVCPPRTPPPCQTCTPPVVVNPPSNGNPGPVYTLPAPSTPDTSQVGSVPSGSVSTGGGSMAGVLPGTSR